MLHTLPYLVICSLNSNGLFINSQSSTACRHIKEKCTIEEQTYLSSHDVDVKNIAHSIRRHWGVENQVHWRMDVTFREDDSRIRRKHAAQNMASLRRFVMNLARLYPDKKSMRRKLKNCGWDDDFREKLLFG